LGGYRDLKEMCHCLEVIEVFHDEVHAGPICRRKIW